MTAERLFLEAWKAGVEIAVNGKKLHLIAPTRPPEALLKKLRERKPEILRFLCSWIETPYGQAKFWGFIGEDSCGVVLRHQPDKVTFVRRDELGIKPSVEDRAAAVQ
ncbi:MAG: hypothetical protein VCF07_05695 [Nitrospinota bacterium]